MIRKGRMEDCRAVYRLICEMEGSWLPFERFRAIYEKQVGDGQHYRCLVWECDGKVCGVLNLRMEEQLHHADCIAEIMEFAVDSAYRNQGIGKTMLAAARRLAREAGCVQIEVACNQLRADTHRFYLREGMHNFHFKFSRNLTGEDTPVNAIGK